MVVMAAASIQNTRILRFLIVLAAVVVTIFIYASYSTNPSMTPPLRMRNSEYGVPHPHQQLLQKQQIIPSTKDKIVSMSNVAVPAATISSRINAEVGVAASVRGHSTKTIIDQKKAHHHYREPTIDKDADSYVGDEAIDSTAGVGNGLEDVPDEIILERLDHNDLLEEQYGQLDSDISDKVNSSVTAGNIAPASRVKSTLANDHNAIDSPHENEIYNGQEKHRTFTIDKNNLNKIPDSEVLIPTSNLQKFIESADKILKNITVSTDNNKTADKDIENEEKKIIEAQILQSPLNEPKKDKDGENDARVGEVNNIGIISSQISPTSNKQIVKALTTSQADNTAKTTSINKNNSTPRITYSSKGIPTDSVYERGHLNNEIDIDNLCPNQGADIKLLILITSAQDHMLARLAIRQTWGFYRSRRDVATAFVLGRTMNDTINKALTQENHIYGDLIRGNFIDSYNNLTLKTISSLEWVDEHCFHAKYVLKTDDDMFINVPKLLAFLDSHAKETRVIFGRLAKKWKPVRNKKSKYYVSPEQFSAAVFPSFTTGPAYLLTGDIVHELYVRSLQTVYLKLEDVFTTGIVSQQLGVRRLHANEFLNRRIAFNPCNIRKAISIHMIKANEQFDLWKKLLDQTAKCK